MSLNEPIWAKCSIFLKICSYNFFLLQQSNIRVEIDIQQFTNPISSMKKDEKSKDVQSFQSLASLLTFLCFRSIVISLHVFLAHPLGKQPLTLRVLHLLSQAPSSFLSKLANHFNVPSCENPLTLFNFSLALSSSISSLTKLLSKRKPRCMLFN